MALPLQCGALRRSALFLYGQSVFQCLLIEKVVVYSPTQGAVAMRMRALGESRRGNGLPVPQQLMAISTAGLPAIWPYAARSILEANLSMRGHRAIFKQEGVRG